MSDIGELSVRIEGDDQGFDRAVRSSERNLETMGATAARVATRVATLATAASAAAGVLATRTVLQTAAAADEMAKLSQRTGVAVEDLGRFAFAADLSAVSQGELTSGLIRLSRSMQDATAGSGRASDAFMRLGVATQDADGNLRSQADVMTDLADRFAQMQDGATKTALAQEIFGRSGANLIPMLNAGSDGLQRMGDEAERLGLVFDTQTAQAAERLNDNIARLRATATGAARDFSGPIIKSLADFTDGLVRSRQRSQELYEQIGRTTPIIQAINAFGQLGEAIAKALDAWSMRLFPDEQERVNRLVAERVKLEQNIAREIENTRSRTGELMPDEQRRVDLFRANIEAINSEIGALQDLAKQRAMALQVETADRSPFVPLDLPALPETEAVEERIAAIADIMQTNYEAQLQRLREFGMDAHELEMERHHQRLETLTEALLDEALTHEEHIDLVEKLEEEHMRRLEQIRVAGLSRIQKFTEMSFKDQAKTMIGQLQSMTQAAAGESRAMFEINRAASLANAVMKGYESIQNAYAFGSRFGGPPAGAAMAAVAAAASAIQVRGILNQRLGGSSSLPSGATGGGASVPAVAASTATSAPAGAGGGGSTTPATATINIVGESFSRSQVAQLIDAINDLTADGARLVVE